MPVFPNRDLLDEVMSKGFPKPERVMLTHSSAAFARGVDLKRPMGDIDLVVDDDNMMHVVEVLGWTAVGQRKYYAEDLPHMIRYTLSPDRRFDVFAHDFIPDEYRDTGRGRAYPDDLFARHDAKYDRDDDTGLWVASLAHVIASKRGTGREKDEHDIPILEMHLSKETI